jgi:methylated-DNA-[protein]-cysteine S-methyltransferase
LHLAGIGEARDAHSPLDGGRTEDEPMTPPRTGPAIGDDLDPAFDRPSAGGPFNVAAVAAPWGPVHVAASRQAVLGIAVLAPREPFVTDVARRTGRDLASDSRNPLLERALAAVTAFLTGDPFLVESLPLDLADRGAWDRNVLGGVRTLRWGEVTSYGRLARAIGRRGAARAVGGAVGRNPIGLAIPCHRVIAGDGSIGGYGGDWFGSRDELLAIKRELLSMEGVTLPTRSLRD